MRYRDLRSFMRKQQKIMYLHSWVIHLRMVPKEEMDKPNQHGAVAMVEEDQVATITINKDIKYDQQRSVIHELAHIILCELTPEKMTDEQERIIERAVLKLERSYSDLAGLPPEEASRRATQGEA